MSDDNNEKSLMDRFTDTFIQWTINAVQVVVAVFVIGFGIQAVMFYVDPENAPDAPGGREIVQFLVRCDSLEAGLQADYLCAESLDCTMTRDELVEHQERLEKYGKYCEDSNE